VSVYRKWIPAATVGAVITTTAVITPLEAGAVDLPDRTAQELLTIISEDVTGFSGTVVKSSALGLPELEMSQMISEDMVEEMEATMPDGFEEFLPSVVEQSSLTDAISLLAGDDTIRVYASTEGFRAQVMDPLSQRDVIVTPEAFYSYNARTQSVLTKSLERDEFTGDAEQKRAEAMAQFEQETGVDATNPDAVADYFLAEADQHSVISVGEDHRVAGRDAYRLIVTPRSSVSLVDRVEISVDAETGLGLATTVYSTQQSDPALEVAFESISFAEPDASLFEFTPPPGASVSDIELPDGLESQAGKLADESASEEERRALLEQMVEQFAPGANPEIIGEGWEMIAHADTLPHILPVEMLENELFSDLMVDVEGGRAFSTPLGNVLITDAGEAFAGAVTLEYLLSVAN
jgi:outer membrane lipoprotein-sorting protein